MTRLLVLLVALGCSKSPPPDASVAAPVERVSPAAPAAPAESAATPRSLYEECRERVENPEADGECTTDADCAPAGCSRETCTTAAAGKELMSTCDHRPCFAVLDACGCVSGRCSWSIKESLPEGLEVAPKVPARPGVPPIPSGPQ